MTGVACARLRGASTASIEARIAPLLDPRLPDCGEGDTLDKTELRPLMKRWARATPPFIVK